MNFTVTGLTVACLLLAPVILTSVRTWRARVPVCAAIMGWLAYALSARVNGVASAGPNELVFLALAVYVAGIAYFARTIEEIATVAVGIGIGTCAFYLAVGTPLTIGSSFADLWKYGICPAVSLILIYLLVLRRASRLLLLTALAALTIVSLGLNFRSHALVCVVTGVVMLIDSRRARSIPRSIVAIGALGSIAAFSKLLPVVSATGVLGTALESKVLSQQSEAVPAILAGRTESPLSITAILEKPWLGWGNAGALPNRVFIEAKTLAVDLGFPRNFNFDYAWRPSGHATSFHSVVLGSWAEAGVFAAIFPLWLLAMCIGLVLMSSRAGRWAPIVILLAVQASWDLLFSPWSYNLATTLAAVAVLGVTMRRRAAPAAGDST